VDAPAYGVRVAEKLPNALHVIGPGQGHGIAGVGCVPRLIAEFVAQGGHDGLDFSCLETQGPTPFFLDFAGPGP